MNIEVITGGEIGTNCYLLINENRVSLIDFVPEAEEFIRENQLIPENIYLTHIHYDHFEGLSGFQSQYPVRLFLSKFAYDHINDPDYTFSDYLAGKYQGTIKLSQAELIDESSEIKIDNHHVRVLESPGHSLDSVIYILDDLKIVFTGDTLFQLSIGRTDLPGGDYHSLIRSAQKLFNKVKEDYLIYPGHGPSSTIGFEKKNNPFLKDLID
jgi:glyoxylase-like metal-dependent hydrolase (beta-lactamase superfamily II)